MRRQFLAGCLAGLSTCAIVLAAGTACGIGQPTEPATQAVPTDGSGIQSPLTRSDPPPPTAVPGFDYTEPGAVCRAFVVAMLGHDTTADSGPSDSYRRAGAYMTEPVSATEGERGDPRWAQWASHRAKVVVELADWVGEPPADEADAVFRGVTATATPVGADGWRGPAERQTVFCSLKRVESGWRVSHYDVDYLD